MTNKRWKKTNVFLIMVLVGIGFWASLPQRTTQAYFNNPPSPGCVTVYYHAEADAHTGISKEFCAGEYDSIALGDFAQEISSVEVGTGARVTLYAYPGPYAPLAGPYTSDVSNLLDVPCTMEPYCPTSAGNEGTFNDATRYMVVEDTRPPDLTVTAPDPNTNPSPPANPGDLNYYSVGDQVRWNIDVCNSNTGGPAVSSDVAYYLGTSCSDFSNRIGDDGVTALDSGECDAENLRYTFVEGDIGERYLIVRADYLSAVTESNETNNEACYTAGFEVLPGVPNAPTITAPTNNAILNRARPTFTWSNTGAEGYIVTIDGTQHYKGSATSYTPGTDLTDGQHSWSVKAYNGTAESGEATGTFFIDTQVPNGIQPGNPTDGSTSCSNTPTFSWTAGNDPPKNTYASGIAGYEVQIDDQAAEVINNPATVSYTPPTGLTDGNHTWQIRTFDAAGNYSAWTNPAIAFTIDTATVPLPTLTSPTAAAPVCSARVDFQWSVPNRTCLDGYEFRLDGGTSETVAAGTGTAATHTATVGEGNHTWSVRSRNEAGNYSAWVDGAVVVDTSPPSVPVLVSPADKAIMTNTTPTFDWQDSTDISPVTYTLQLNTPDGTEDIPITNSEYTPATDLAQGNHTWTVKAHDTVCGFESAWATARSFAINTPPINVTITGPVTGTIGATYTFTATVKPEATTLPITYTWEATDQTDITHTDGGLEDTVSFTWQLTGTKMITVTATNSVGEVVDTHTITIGVPPATVAITGTSAGTVGISYPFTATVAPITTTLPITYTWQATDQTTVVHTDKPLQDTRLFTWDTPGTKMITVTATNLFGSVSTTHTVTIGVPPATVAITGTHAGTLGTSYPFTATVAPITTTLPITYTWQTTDHPDIHHVDEITNTLAITWTLPGTKIITVTATNLFGSVTTTHTVTIGVPPSTVAITGTHAGTLGTSYPFTATVAPITTTLPITYTWQATDHPDIHHVDGITNTLAITWTLPGTKIITVTATNLFGSVSTTHTIEITKSAIWNLLFYISGDNKNQHENAQAMVNLLEQAASNPTVNILVLWDDKGTNNTQLFYLEHDTDSDTIVSPPITVAWNPGERNMGDPQTLEDFVQWARTTYPADRTMLTIFDHGVGWAPDITDATKQATWMKGGSGLAWDETDSDYLATAEMGKALQNIAADSGNLDVVFHDASLTAMLENAYEIRNSASYLVASQNVMHIVFPYDVVIDTITADTTPEELAKAMVEQYHKKMDTAKKGSTISAITLSKVEELAQAVDGLAQALEKEAIGPNLSKLYNLYEVVQKFDIDQQKEIEQDRESVIDLFHFAELIVTKSTLTQATKDAAQDVLALQSTVILAEEHMSNGQYTFLNANGLSIYLPFGEEVYVGPGCPSFKDFCKVPANKTCIRIRDYYTNTTPSQLAFVEDTLWDNWLNEVIAIRYPCTITTLQTTDTMTDTTDFPTIRPTNILSETLVGNMDLFLNNDGDDGDDDNGDGDNGDGDNGDNGDNGDGGIGGIVYLPIIVR